MAVQSISDTDNIRIQICRKACAGLSLLTGLYGAVALSGALLHVEFLQNQTGLGSLIKVNAALCLILCSVSVLLSLTKVSRVVPITLAITAAAVSGITLIEWLSGWNVGIDQLFTIEQPNTRATSVPGRMAANAAIAFFSLSMGAVLSQLAYGRKTNIDQVLAFVTLSIGQFALLGHAFSLALLKEFWGGTEIAVTLSIMLSAAGCSLILMRAGEGHTKIMVEPTLGGFVIRRLLPWLALIPLIGLAGGFEQWKNINLMVAAVLIVVFLPLAVLRVATTIGSLDAERAEALRQAIASKEEALEAAANKTRFAQLVSHEVRTPLSGVVSLTELLSQEPLQGETKEIALTAYAASTRLMQVLNELLDMQRVEAKSSTTAEPFNIRELVAEVVDIVEPVARKKKLALTSLVHGDVPAELAGDSLRIRQVIINFAHNGIKFTETGSVTLRVNTEKADAEKIWLRFAVEDTGIGIEPAQQSKLFEAFSQANSSIAKHFGGTGLGLSICKQFAENMKGELGMESVAGKGSKFWMAVPLTIIKNDQREEGGDMESTFVNIDKVP